MKADGWQRASDRCDGRTVLAPSGGRQRGPGDSKDDAMTPTGPVPDRTTLWGRTGGSGSGRTVVVALTANLLVALAKSGAALITGSVAVLAEAAHSWADTGNEVLLLVAHRRSRRPPDPTHPLGHGREAYVWSLVRCAGPVRRRCCGGSDPFGAIRADT